MRKVFKLLEGPAQVRTEWHCILCFSFYFRLCGLIPAVLFQTGMPQRLSRVFLSNRLTSNGIGYIYIIYTPTIITIYICIPFYIYIKALYTFSNTSATLHHQPAVPKSARNLKKEKGASAKQQPAITTFFKK